MQFVNVRKIAFAGVVAALYATLTMAVAPIAYGPIQFRIAEVLCILPFFFPYAAPGLFVGCVVANLLSPYGILDVIAGSIATLVAALLTMRLGHINKDAVAVKALACFPPVLCNAVIIGAVIARSVTTGTGGGISGGGYWPAFAIYGMQVGVGQLVVMYAAGLPLMIYLPKSHIFMRMSEQYNM